MINVKTHVGLLDKIRVIKTQPLLVRFTLETIHQPLNCIVANVEIADKLMMMEEIKYNIAVTGHLNRRNQLVVESLQVRIQINIHEISKSRASARSTMKLVRCNVTRRFQILKHHGD